MTKRGYFTKPDINDLAQFKFEYLMEIEGFTILNKHGMIEFEGFTDVTYLNLDKLVDIDQNGIEVYPENVKKPPLGKKLNKSAILTFNKCRYSKKMSHKKVLKKLIKKAEDQVELFLLFYLFFC